MDGIRLELTRGLVSLVILSFQLRPPGLLPVMQDGEVVLELNIPFLVTQVQSPMLLGLVIALLHDYKNQSLTLLILHKLPNV